MGWRVQTWTRVLCVNVCAHMGTRVCMCEPWVSVNVCTEICDGFMWTTVRWVLSTDQAIEGQRQAPVFLPAAVCVRGLSPDPETHICSWACARAAPGRCRTAGCCTDYIRGSRRLGLKSGYQLPLEPASPILGELSQHPGLMPRTAPRSQAQLGRWGPGWPGGWGGKNAQESDTKVSASHSWARGTPGPSQGPPLIGPRVGAQPPFLGPAHPASAATRFNGHLACARL